MKALITGIGGFVGPWLAKELGEMDVVGFDRHGENPLDILDKQAIMRFLEKEKPDWVFHLAAQSSVKKSWEEPELTKKVNVEGTRNLLSAVQGHCPHAKVLVVSSAEVYGIPKKLPLGILPGVSGKC